METIIYIIIFLIGAMFGSFFTLAVYRIPRREDITHTRSYCPKCNHKLGFFDMFPILSYIILGGKCRYCKEKIRPRYLILEILSGLIFVSIFYLMKIDIYNIKIEQVAEYCFMALYLSFLFIIAGIDKEQRKIEKPVLTYGIIISIIYIAYLCIVEKANIYRYVIYLVFYVLILILDTISLKKYAKSKYINGILLMVIVIAIFTGEYVTINTIAFTSLTVAIYILLNKLKQRRNKSLKTDKQVWKDLKIGFYLSITNVLTILYVLLYNNFIV